MEWFYGAKSLIGKKEGRKKKTAPPYRDRGRGTPKLHEETLCAVEVTAYIRRLEEAVSDLCRTQGIGLTRYGPPTLAF